MSVDELAAIAAEQGGLFTRAQARACGYSEIRIRRRLRIGEWQRVLGPVLARPGLAVNPRVRDRAAQLAIPGSVLVGPSAARRHGLSVRTREPTSRWARRTTRAPRAFACCASPSMP